MSFEPALTVNGQPCKVCIRLGEYCGTHNGNVPRPQQVSGMWRTAFLAALRQGLNKKSAAGRAQVTENTVYRHQREDSDFADQVEIAYNEGTAKLEDIGWERIEDEDKPSDVILKHLLAVRGIQPKTKVEVSGPDGGPIETKSTIPFDLLSPALKAQIVLELESIEKGDAPVMIEGEVLPEDPAPSQ